MYHVGVLPALLLYLPLPNPSLDLREKNPPIFSCARLCPKWRAGKRKHLPNSLQHSFHELRSEKANTPKAHVQGSKGHFRPLQEALRGLLGHSSGYLAFKGELCLLQLVLHLSDLLSVRYNCFRQIKPNIGCDFKSSAHVAVLQLSVPSSN